MGRGLKSGGIENILVFPHIVWLGGLEKWMDGKLFYLVEKKNKRIKVVFCMNVLLERT